MYSSYPGSYIERHRAARHSADAVQQTIVTSLFVFLNSFSTLNHYSISHISTKVQIRAMFLWAIANIAGYAKVDTPTMTSNVRYTCDVVLDRVVWIYVSGREK